MPILTAILNSQQYHSTNDETNFYYNNDRNHVRIHTPERTPIEPFILQGKVTMNRKQTRTAVEKVRRVHNILADVITTMDLSIEVSSSLSSVEKAQYERYWREAHMKALQDLQESLSYLAHTQTAVPVKLGSRP